MHTVTRQQRRQRRQQRRRWSAKYKKSIDCSAPRGFSQRQYCKYGRNNKKTMRKNDANPTH